MTYCLYEPLAHNKPDVVYAVLKSIRRIFYLLGTIIGIGSIICCWKMDFFVRPEDMVPGIRLFFLMFMFSQASSYFCYSKAILLEADQCQYITIIANNGGNCVQLILQMIFVVFTKNYFIYLLITIIVNLVKFFIVSRIATNRYPDVFRGDFRKDSRIPESISTRLKVNVIPMFFHKIGKTVISSTDTILLSMLFGTAIVGRYNNYVLLSNAFMTVFWLLAKSITPSIGDICVDEMDGSVPDLYDQVFFGNFLFSTISGVVFTVLAQPFIDFSFGISNELSMAIVFTLGINLFLNSLRTTNSTFRDALGLFSPDWYKPILEAVFNIIVSYFLAMHIGAVGILVGTTLTYTCISIWIEPYVIVKVGLKRSVWKFYLKTLAYIAAYLIICTIAIVLCSTIGIESHLAAMIVNVIAGASISIAGCSIFAIWSSSARKTFRQLKGIVLNKRG